MFPDFHHSIIRRDGRGCGSTSVLSTIHPTAAELLRKHAARGFAGATLPGTAFGYPRERPTDYPLGYFPD